MTAATFAQPVASGRPFTGTCPGCFRTGPMLSAAAFYAQARTVVGRVRAELGPRPGGALLGVCGDCWALSMTEHATKRVRRPTIEEWRLLNDCPTYAELREYIDRKHHDAGHFG